MLTRAKRYSTGLIEQHVIVKYKIKQRLKYFKQEKEHLNSNIRK
jgi:hypothetical protein